MTTGYPRSNPGGQDRVFFTQRALDPQQNPPADVDVVLPTQSITLRGPLKRGRTRAPAGTILGSYRITGSHRELTAPGTYSLRVTRVSLASGSRETGWVTRPSREGTRDIVYFPNPGHVELLGRPDAPIYAFGPGTIIYGFLEAGSRHFLSQSMEGYLT